VHSYVGLTVDDLGLTVDDLGLTVDDLDTSLTSNDHVTQCYKYCVRTTVVYTSRLLHCTTSQARMFKLIAVAVVVIIVVILLIAIL